MSHSPLAPSRLPAALFSAAETRALDQYAISRGVPGYTLMARAAEAAFAALRRRWPAAHSIVVLCGVGNNAGDGYLVAQRAQIAGMAVKLYAVSDPNALTGDALSAYQAASDQLTVERFHADSLSNSTADVIVDALFGTGLNRPIDGINAAAISAVNAHPSAMILALDLPSGLHADSGQVLGEAIRCDLCVSFIGLNRGLFTGQGPDYVGEIWFDDLGVSTNDVNHDRTAPTASSWLYQGEDLPQLLAPRSRIAHKGDHGHLLVIGGDHGMGGAARISAEAGARAGAGLVSVATRGEHTAQQTAQRPELMFRSVSSAADLEPLLARASVIAIGPGLGQHDWGQALFECACCTDLPKVIDADALNLLAALPVSQQRRLQSDQQVLTPHPGEAARLLDTTNAEVQADRFQAAAEIAKRYGGVCVLKGAGTLVHADGQSWVCPAGNPGMASGGMGDLLTGIIGALLAQRLSPLAAARAGVYLHARAADLAAADGERGLLATDLLAPLRRLVNP